MPTEFNFSIESLLVGTQEPVTMTRERRLRDAIQTMRDKQFSQLPVVDAGNHPIGLLTYESIARCLFNFDTSLDSLSVKDALEPHPKTFRVDGEALEILEVLKQEHCVLIVDSGQRLHRVLTLYDAAEYFRQRAQDLVFLEEIEVNLRDWITAAYQVIADAEPAPTSAYADAYRRVSPQPRDLQRPFHDALRAYLQDGPATGTYDGKRAQKLFEEHLAKPGKIKKIDQLTFQESIDLFLIPDAWSLYQAAVGMPDGVVRNLLNKVKDARNNLAHFRPITAEQRERIRFAWDWVREHRDAILASCPKPSAPPAPPISMPTEPGSAVETPGFDDPVGPDESRYAPLAHFLSGIGAMAVEVSLPFVDIERLIGGKLPQSAWEQRAWWANDGHTHVQAKQWLNVGWRVTAVDFAEAHVIFQRNKEREQQYIRFFHRLIPELKKVGAFAGSGSTAGKSYLLLKRLPETRPVGSVHFAFTRGARSRIELYLDSPNEQENKANFDRLLGERNAIESELGTVLVWERLDGHISSRIAIVTEGFITDDEATLSHLIQWAADMAPRFQRAFAKRLNAQRQ